MILLKEDSSLILRRKYRYILGACGKGLFLFAVWSVIKGLMSIFLDTTLVQKINEAVESTGIGRSFFIFCFVLIIVFDLLLRLAVAGMTQKAAKGKRPGIFPLILAVLLIVTSIYVIYDAIWETSMYYGLFDRLVTVLVELTCIFNLTEIIVYSVKLRRLPEPSAEVLPEKEAD